MNAAALRVFGLELRRPTALTNSRLLHPLSILLNVHNLVFPTHESQSCLSFSLSPGSGCLFLTH